MLRTGERLGGDASPYRGRSLRLSRQAMLGTGERLGRDASPYRVRMATTADRRRRGIPGGTAGTVRGKAQTYCNNAAEELLLAR